MKSIILYFVFSFNIPHVDNIKFPFEYLKWSVRNERNIINKKSVLASILAYYITVGRLVQIIKALLRATIKSKILTI